MSTAVYWIANGLIDLPRLTRRHLPMAAFAGLYLAVFAGWLWLLAAVWLGIAIATLRS